MENPFNRISVIGLGYIGLPTAAMFASHKVEVVGLDVNQTAVDTINRGDIHIVEPGLGMVVKKAVHDGYLRATTTPEPADAFLIAVPTPFKAESHEPELSYVKAAAEAIAPVLERGNLVILESTSPVGTTEAMAGWLAKARPDLSFPQIDGEASDIRVAYCPERVLPGKVMQELITNDRVIGGLTPLCSERAVELYKVFVTGSCVVASSPRVAEMVKLAENSFRDVNIAFANEVSLICDKHAIDVWEMISLANRHPRVNILQPGPGVGGHCIAVDPWFIVSSAPDQARLIRSAREVNDAKPEWVLEKIDAAVKASTKETPSEIIIACYGLTFKPDIDDLRESPAYAIAKRLHDKYPGQVICVEPHITDLPSGLSSSVLHTTDEALAIGDIHVFLVAHSEFRLRLSPTELNSRVVVDTCGLLKETT